MFIAGFLAERYFTVLSIMRVHHNSDFKVKHGQWTLYDYHRYPVASDVLNESSFVSSAARHCDAGICSQKLG